MDKYYFQFGGDPDWYNKFENELKDIYFNVKVSTDNLTVGGSAAIALILKKLNMLSELNTFDKPNDFDFMYIDKDVSHPNILNFTKSINTLEKSITYDRKNNRELYTFNSFDLIFIPSKGGSIYNIIIDDIYVLHPKSLLSYYKDNDFDTTRNQDKDQRRITILENILKIIKDKNDNYIHGFEYKKFIPDNTPLPNILNFSDVSSSLSFESPAKKLKFDYFSTPGGAIPDYSINDYYKKKYFKYKLKYLNLKKN
jgi:hypothetical protein